MSLQHLLTKFSGLFPVRSSDEEISTKKDRISQLPDEILASILSHLSVKEAVKTRVLSRRWRHILLLHLLASRSHIKFDYDWIGPHPERCEKLAFTFVQDINRFLNRYRGPNISLFQVICCLGNKFASDIDRWITYAIKLGVEELIIYCACIGRPLMMKQPELYTFSFHHLSEANELKRLSLGPCILKRDCSFSGQFLSLKFLNLRFATLVDQSMLLFILSRCSNLEELRLWKCVCPAVLSFRGPFLRLKTLIVKLCDGLEEIDVSITTLTTLKVCTNRCEFNVVLSCVPNLKTVYCDTFFCDKKRYRINFSNSLFSRIVNDVPQLHTLFVAANILLVESIPPTLAAFGNLQKLEFSLKIGLDPFDIRKIIPVLVACPLLQIFNLIIKQYVIGAWSRVEARTMKDIPELCHAHLREVEFYGFQGTESQLELASYLLKSAVVLERMVISPCDKNYLSYEQSLKYKLQSDKFGKCQYRNPEPWNNRKHKYIIEQLQGKATSQHVELKFYRYPEECPDAAFDHPVLHS